MGRATHGHSRLLIGLISAQRCNGHHDPSGGTLHHTRYGSGTSRNSRGRRDSLHAYGVTEDQIRQLKLPTRPTRPPDSRSKSFEGESVEVDAIPCFGNVAASGLRNVIEAHIDVRALEQTRLIEERERETLARMMETLKPHNVRLENESIEAPAPAPVRTVDVFA